MKKFFLKQNIFIVVLLLMLGISFIYGADPKITEIVILGNYKIREDAIRKFIKIEEKEKLDKTKISEAIKALFKTGYFSDVKVFLAKEIGRNIVTFNLSEKPSVFDIQFEGNEKVKTEDLLEAIQTKTYSFLDIAKVFDDERAIGEYYEDKGYSITNIEHELEKLPENEVVLKFKLTEGKRVVIKRVNIIGNKFFSEEKIKNVLQTKEGGLLTPLAAVGITQSGAYREEIFRIDQTKLQYFYLKYGFLNFKFHEPEVMLSPDKKWIYINMKIEEGDRFSLNSMSFSGDLIKSKEELSQKVKSKIDKIVDYEHILMDVQAIVEIYKDEGYAFVNVIPNSKVDAKNKRVDFVFEIDKGNLIYVDKIDIVGNETTRDKFVRRQMAIVEGDLYSGSKIRESIFNIRRYPFISDARINEEEGSDPNKVDLKIEITERQTGTFTVGAGFSSAESFNIMAQIQKENLLGYGWTVNFRAVFGGRRQAFNINFIDPYFLDTNFSLSVSAFNIETSYRDFTPTRRGGRIIVGYPIYKNIFRVSLGYNFEDVRISNLAETQRELITSGQTSSILTSISRDTRNRLGYFETTSGAWTSFQTEFAGTKFLGGDNSFAKLLFEHRHFFTVIKDQVPIVGGSVIGLRGQLSYILSSNGDPVPVFERFFPGGIYSLRGFEVRSLGPRVQVASGTDPDTMVNEDFVIGGNKELLMQVEYIIPIFKAHGIKWVFFYDTGNAFNNGEQIDIRDLRHDVGFGIRWFSPIAPLRFEWGFPLDKKEGEAGFMFNFAIGTPF